MRRSMSSKPYSLGNPMESIESMRKKIVRRSIKRIKGKITTDLKNMSNYFKAQTDKKVIDPNKSKIIYELNDDGSLIQSDFHLDIRPSTGRSIPTKSFEQFIAASSKKKIQKVPIKDIEIFDQESFGKKSIHGTNSKKKCPKSAVRSPNIKAVGFAPYQSKKYSVPFDSRDIEVVPIKSKIIPDVVPINQSIEDGTITLSYYLKDKSLLLDDHLFNESEDDLPFNKSAREEVQNAFNRLASIAREDLRQSIKTVEPSSDDLMN